MLFFGVLFFGQFRKSKKSIQGIKIAAARMMWPSPTWILALNTRRQVIGVFSFFFEILWNAFWCVFFVSCSHSGPELRIYMIYAFWSPLKLSTFWGVADPWFGCKESTISTICQQKIHLVLETEAPSISCSSDWWFPLPAFFSMFLPSSSSSSFCPPPRCRRFGCGFKRQIFFIVYPPRN